MTATNTRAQALADQYTQATENLLTVVESAPPAGWQTLSPNEARTVGVLVHHLANSAPMITDLLRGVVAGNPPPPITKEQIDHGNARHAEEYAAVGPAETVALLRQNSAATAALIRGLSDDQLELTASLPLFGPTPVAVSQIVEYLLIGHTLGHLASIQVALEG